MTRLYAFSTAKNNFGDDWHRFNERPVEDGQQGKLRHDRGNVAVLNFRHSDYERDVEEKEGEAHVDVDRHPRDALVRWHGNEREKCYANYQEDDWDYTRENLETLKN